MWRGLWLIPITGLLGFACLPGIVKPPDGGSTGAVDPMTRAVQITGNQAPFNYSMAELQVNRGDTIRWSAAVPFEIDLGIDGPTDRRIVSGVGGQSGIAVIRLAAPAGEYKYSVTLRIGNLLITDDPRLIVREERVSSPDD
jgi:plastocyanin